MLAIIPAKKNSTRIPGKNMKLLCGKPLIYYTLKAATDSKEIDKIIIATNSDETFLYCQRNFPHVMMAHLNEWDFKGSVIDVYLKILEDTGELEFIGLQPTSPLRLCEDIDNAISLYWARLADCVMGVTETPFPPEWLLKIGMSGTISGYFGNEVKIIDSQKAQKAYIGNGAMFVVNGAFLKKNRTYYSNNTIGYLMDRMRSVDIDTMEDFYLAEKGIKDLQNEGYESGKWA